MSATCGIARIGLFRISDDTALRRSFHCDKVNLVLLHGADLREDRCGFDKPRSLFDCVKWPKESPMLGLPQVGSCRGLASGTY